MQQNNQDKVEQARHLYFAQAKTQKEIAHLLDVSEKTIYNWIRRYSWDQMRQAARQAPALISENLCSQIVELQNSISRREPGLRYATAEESLIMQRLITMLDKMKKYPGLSMNMQVMQTFRSWASTRDKSFNRDLNLYSGLFLQGYAQNGYYPYELEFGMDKISPFDPFYKEGSKDDDLDSSENQNVIPGLSKDAEKAEKQQPENPAPKPSQLVENQFNVIPSLSRDNFPPPENTGNSPATPPAENHEYPWRKLHSELQKPHNDHPASHPNLNPPGE